MKTFFKPAGSICLITLFAATLILSGLGSGIVGGSDVAASGRDSASQTGTAALLLWGAPSDEYYSLMICVNEVTLEPGSVLLFSAGEEGCVEVDLLDHQEEPFLLDVNDQVPARTYYQIRITADYIRTEVGPCDTLDIELPSNVIKINPQGGIPIKSGDKVVIDIDVTAKQSVNIHVEGTGKCILRPVILAEVRTFDDFLP